METKIESDAIETIKELYDIMGILIGDDFADKANDIMIAVKKGKELADRTMRIIALQAKLQIAYLQQWLYHPKKKPRKINRICKKIKALQEESVND